MRRDTLTDEKSRRVCIHTYDDPTEILNLPNPRMSGDAFAGASWNEAVAMSRAGWQEGVKDSLPIVESALRMAEKVMPTDSFEVVWEKTGSEVDISRYLTGLPENMIEYQPVKISKVGHVVTLVASICTSAAISHDSIMARGAVLTALAMALEELQHPCEIWVDFSTHRQGNRDSRTGKRGTEKVISVRVKVKGSQDVIDPAVLAFWLGHPASQRKLCMAGAYHLADTEKEWASIRPSNSYVFNPFSYGYPDGAIMTPGLDVRNMKDHPEEYILETLREINLLD